MKSAKKSITYKVLIGYLLITAFAVFAVWVVYRQIVSITEANKIGNANNEKLFLISEAVTNLYVAEGISRDIIQNTNPDLLPKFNAEIDTIVVLIDSLKKMYHEKNVRAELDSITRLLALKEENLKELLAIREKGETESYYARVMEKLRIKQKQAKKPDYPENLEDLGPKVQELLRRVKEYERSQEVGQPKVDSLFRSMKNILLNLDVEERRYQSTITEKENELLENDRQISSQLRNIRSEIEQEEVQKSVAQVTESQRRLEHTSNLIALVAVVAVLTVLIFVVLIVRDTNRSQKYRQELEHSKNFAESLLKGREQMMAAVSHDLRSPLNTITGYSDLLKNTPLNDQQEHYLDHLKKSSGYILRLVNDLLDLSKLEVGKMMVEKLPFNPKNLIQETLEQNIPANDPKNLQIITEFSKNLDRQIVSDPFRMQQILVNLISNAYKFTEKGKIEVSAWLQEKSQKHILKIQISDSGIGIAKEQQEAIFEEFSQAGGFIERKYGGFGLGLAITKKLTELLNGSLQLKSKLGEGSTFIISLPVELSENRFSPENSEKPESLGFEETLDKRILVIDDEASELALTSEILRQAGIYFETSKNPLIAVKMIHEKHFDLILTDIQMPKMNGFELIRKLKQSSKTADIPIIALSGRTDVHRNLYLEKGFKGNLIKPYRPSELIDLIGKTLGLKTIHNHSQNNRSEIQPNKFYDLTEVKTFTQEDSNALNGILRAFIDSNRKNIKALGHFAEKGAISAISETAHKMLPMFKQLKIKSVIPDLEELEKADFHRLSEAHVKLLVEKITKKMKGIFEELQKEL
ncbi:MAG TPA: ATP-binding protein [Flavobacteriaceae bacterium]|nr:ATP-binding protein [Flavobacteriaceae bacterium]